MESHDKSPQSSDYSNVEWLQDRVCRLEYELAAWKLALDETVLELMRVNDEFETYVTKDGE